MYVANFRRYWKEHLVHIAVAYLAGRLLVGRKKHRMAGGAIMTTVYTRQTLEYAKRDDTPGIDLAYHLTGLILGILHGIGAIRRAAWWIGAFCRAWKATKNVTHERR